jgi:hypothetical protein
VWQCYPASSEVKGGARFVKKAYTPPEIREQGDIHRLTRGGPGQGDWDALWDWRFFPLDIQHS